MRVRVLVRCAAYSSLVYSFRAAGRDFGSVVRRGSVPATSKQYLSGGAAAAIHHHAFKDSHVPPTWILTRDRNWMIRRCRQVHSICHSHLPPCRQVWTPVGEDLGASRPSRRMQTRADDVKLTEDATHSGSEWQQAKAGWVPRRNKKYKKK
ncbi:uncharacterized protein LOC135099722 isoform X2 [Scylla paramamosain]|uniref:uncharacterized protein LOC135099722 isoform X2 n=1 Tax=Scylla paramamosain TaxID=85552 RepID=UPI003082AD06